VLIPDGELCYCGKRGCVEKILSGPALEAWYFSQAGQKRSLTEIVSLASSSKDAVAAATLDRLYREFGRAIAVVINILDPNVVVLGGGLSNIPGLCEEGSRYARHYVFNDRFETRIVPHQLGDSAGVFGAAALTEEV
jgi:predicted NBD/HSP70 family sugar kinase